MYFKEGLVWFNKIHENVRYMNEKLNSKMCDLMNFSEVLST
jgi:hypothetical protein